MLFSICVSGSYSSMTINSGYKLQFRNFKLLSEIGWATSNFKFERTLLHHTAWISLS